MKYFLNFLFLFLLTNVFSQNDSVRWESGFSKAIGPNEVWTSDLIGNLMLTRKNNIEKYDSTGNLRFSQSIRSIGKVAQITPVNTMKLMVFSEEQQRLCFLDNTLTLTEECLDLSGYTVEMASHAAVSGQTDRVWVMDQYNSRLLSLQLGKVANYQEIKNLKGILQIDAINGLLEFNNDLYLLDKGKGIYQFDQYGTLIRKMDELDVSAFAFSGQSMIIVQKDTLKLIDLKTEESLILSMPVKDVKEFTVLGNVFFFRTENKIYRYRLSLPN